MKFPEIERITIGRSNSYLRSVWLGLVVAVFCAPLHLFVALAPALRKIGQSLIMLMVGILAWLVVRIVYLIAGFMGRVCVVPAGPGKGA